MHPKIAARRRKTNLNYCNRFDLNLQKILEECDHHLSCIDRMTPRNISFLKEREFCKHARYLLQTTSSDTKIGLNARSNIVVGLTQLHDIMRDVVSRSLVE